MNELAAVRVKDLHTVVAGVSYALKRNQHGVLEVERAYFFLAELELLKSSSDKHKLFELIHRALFWPKQN